MQSSLPSGLLPAPAPFPNSWTWSLSEDLWRNSTWFLCSDTERLSALLDYWGIVAAPLLSGIHSMKRFSHIPSPYYAQLSLLGVTYQISLDSFLGSGAWACVCVEGVHFTEDQFCCSRLGDLQGTWWNKAPAKVCLCLFCLKLLAAWCRLLLTPLVLAIWWPQVAQQLWSSGGHASVWFIDLTLHSAGKA